MFTTAKPVGTPTNDSVTGLSVTNLTSSGLTLSWTAPANPSGTIDGYHVYNNGTKITTTPVTATTYNATLPADTAYSLTVAAVVGGQEKIASQATVGTTPPVSTQTDDTVTGLNISNITETSMTLNWTAPTNPSGTITGYNVYVGTATTPANGSSPISAATLTYQVAGLTADTDYTLHVKTLVDTTESQAVSVNGKTNATVGDNTSTYANFAAPLAAGASMYSSYHRVYGDSQFCAPVLSAPDFNSSDKYAAGRKIKSGFASIWPNINYNAYNFSTFVVDTSKPEGSTSSGGGNYTMQKLYQSNETIYEWMRDRGGPYELETQSNPVPLDFHPAVGTDGAAAVYDIATDTLREYWIVRQQTASTNYVSKISGTVPVGSWRYNTCAVTYGLSGKDGGHQFGNVTASAVWGPGIQLGLEECLLAAGLKQNSDGSYTSVPPKLNAIQHVIGIEVLTTQSEGRYDLYSKPARYSDARDNPISAGLMHGQRLQLDPSFAYSDTSHSNLCKAISWTLKNYGAFVTDCSGAVAFRGEE